jgi:putative iron-regulated protein
VEVFEVVFMSRRRRVPVALVVLVVAAGLLAAGCGGEEAKVSPADKQAVAENYANIVLASYGAAIDSATGMQGAIDAFLDRPSRGRLDRARRAWLSARDDYIVTEPFRFYGGPIDNAKDGPEGLINAWPLDEAYIDYVTGASNSGIVNDRRDHPRITTGVIVEANERGGETNISSGWHAIEFLLWGQDHSKSGPGDRPVSDYTTARNATRRATYLRLTTQRLLDDLRHVRDQWQRTGGEYRATFLADPDMALTNILRGVGALNSGELAGDRTSVPFDSGDQEDEHSCFSDNTNADVVNDLRGIQMVYRGEFPGISGASLHGLVEKADPGLASKLDTQISATLAGAKAFPATFERMIAAPAGSPQHEALGKVIDGIEAQGSSLAAAATALGVKVNFEV